MRILVYPHDLKVGGSQINAIEIAARMSRLGHEVVVFGHAGPLLDRISQLQLEFVPSPTPRRRPSPAVLRTLSSLVQRRQIQIVHGYEWPPALEAWMVATSCANTAAVGTIMSMAVAPFLPMQLPLVVGTAQIAAAESDRGRRRVSSIEPPVDLVHNDPHRIDGLADFKSQWGLDGPGLNVVAVTRLSHEMKLEGLLTAIDVVPQLSAATPLRLLIVGTGPAEGVVRYAADAANAQLGRRAVILTGEMSDPRLAYQSADIALGMGSSALRALAYAKPLIVQGERGFWQTLTPESLDDFMWTGWYGVGRGSVYGARGLTEALAPLLEDPALRTRLGTFGRSTVEMSFNLEHAVTSQLDVYQQAMEWRRQQSVDIIDASRSTVRYLRYVGKRKAARLMGRAPADDFNALPVLAAGPPKPALR
jgi:L-malate glycosyltransferase